MSKVAKTFRVELELSDDGPNKIDFMDTYGSSGESEWYKFEVDQDGSIYLNANKEGYEHLARYFLKLARTEKSEHFHTHHSLEFGQERNDGPELIISISSEPAEIQGQGHTFDSRGKR